VSLACLTYLFTGGGKDSNPSELQILYTFGNSDETTNAILSTLSFIFCMFKSSNYLFLVSLNFGECERQQGHCLCFFVQVKLREMKPGTLSKELKEALGMPEGAPPPWLINMQVIVCKRYVEV